MGAPARVADAGRRQEVSLIPSQRRAGDRPVARVGSRSPQGRLGGCSPRPDCWNRCANSCARRRRAAILLMIAAAVALLVANSPLWEAWDALWHTQVGVVAGCPPVVDVAGALGERRPDGRVLPGGRPGDQARAAHGRAAGASHGPAAHRGGRGWCDRARAHLHRHQRRRPGCLRMGHPDGHGHRLCPGRAGHRRVARAGLAQGIPDHPGHRG